MHHMARAHLCVLLLLCFHGFVVKAQDTSSSNTQHKDTVVNIEDKPRDTNTTFQLVTSCVGSTFTRSANSRSAPITGLQVTIEMDHVPTYADNEQEYNGTTRMNVTVTASQPFANPDSMSVEIHSKACSSDMLFSRADLYSQNGSLNTPVALTANNLTLAHSIDLNFNDTTASSSTEVPYLTDYDQARAAVLWEGNVPLACCSLVPPFPDFPADWSVTLEANMVERQATFVLDEYHSSSLNAVRTHMHAFNSERIVLHNFTTHERISITVDQDTHPKGKCEVHQANDTRMTTSSSNHTTLASTAEFLRFGGAAETPARYVEGTFDVRGIPCEKWEQVITPDANRSYVLEYYFPHNTWLVARETYHRLLKEIRLKGTGHNGTAVEHYYNFVNFRPYVASSKVFDVCSIAPEGENCNCTAADVAAAVLDSPLAADPGIVRDTAVVGAADMICDCPDCKTGFIVLYILIGLMTTMTLVISGWLAKKLWFSRKQGGRWDLMVDETGASRAMNPKVVQLASDGP